MGVQFIGPAALYFARKGVEGYIKYRKAKRANKKLLVASLIDGDGLQP